MYSTADTDRALQLVGNDFIDETHALKTSHDYALTSGDDEIVVSPGDMGLGSGQKIMPENLTDLTLSDRPHQVEVLNYSDFNRRRVRSGLTQTGVAQIAAISDSNADPTAPGAGFTILLWPANDTTDRTLTARLWINFTSWSVGTTNAASITLNLPDHWLTPILTYGVPATLQHNEPEHKYASATWQKYVDFRTRMKGKGSMGIRTAGREMME